MDDLIKVTITTSDKTNHGPINTIHLNKREANLTSDKCSFWSMKNGESGYDELMKYFNDKNTLFLERAVEFYVKYKCYDKLREDIGSFNKMDIILYSIMYKDEDLFNEYIEEITKDKLESYKIQTSILHPTEFVYNLFEYICLVYHSTLFQYKRKHDIRYRDKDDPRELFIINVVTKIGAISQNLKTELAMRFSKSRRTEYLMHIYKGFYLCVFCNKLGDIHKLLKFDGCDCGYDLYGCCYDQDALSSDICHLECITDDNFSKCSTCGKDLSIVNLFN